MEPAPAPSRRLCSCVVRCCTVTGSAWISSEAEPHGSNRIHDDPELEAQEQIHDDPALEAQEQPPEERAANPVASENFDNLQERVRALEDTPETATLHTLARRAPNSFHQATVYYGLVSETASTTKKCSLLAVSFGIVLLQCAVASGLAFGTENTSCADPDDCYRGTFCDRVGYCEQCEHPSLGLCTGNTTVADIDDYFSNEADLISMCDACTNTKSAHSNWTNARLWKRMHKRVNAAR